jgi:hypothetical protein
MIKDAPVLPMRLEQPRVLRLASWLRPEPFPAARESETVPMLLRNDLAYKR